MQNEHSSFGERLRSEAEALLDFATQAGERGADIAALRSALDSQASHGALQQAYGAVVQRTYPVNGRSVLASAQGAMRRASAISVITVLFFLLAVGNEMADQWFADLPERGEPWLWMDLKQYVWDYLAPFLWGGLGSCVFLLKKLSDKAAASQYDPDKLKGWGTRILLGSVLAAAVVSLYDPSAFTGNAAGFGPNGIAFLTGLGVKVVYGALERTVEVLSDKLNLRTTETKIRSESREPLANASATPTLPGAPLAEEETQGDADQGKVDAAANGRYLPAPRLAVGGLEGEREAHAASAR